MMSLQERKQVTEEGCQVSAGKVPVIASPQSTDIHESSFGWSVTERILTKKRRKRWALPIQQIGRASPPRWRMS